MFTLKKIALVSAAGLTAFSISCSDTEGDDAGGTWTKSFDATFDNSAKTIDFAGQATALESGQITSVTITAGGLSNVITGLSAITSTLPASTIDLDGVFAGIQTICGTQTSGNKDVKVEVTVAFTAGSGANLTGSKNVTVTCGSGSGGGDPDLIKAPITLSLAGQSYADLDATPVVTLNQASALSAVNIAKIDLVAYNTSTAAAKIYTPLEEPAELFYDDDTGAFLGSTLVAFFTIPSEYASVINNATKLSQLEAFFGFLETFIDTAPPVFEVSIANNTAFLVSTSEQDLVAVVITNSGVQTVTLGTTKIQE